MRVAIGVAAAFAALAVPAAAGAATLTVSTNADSGTGSLRAAIAASSPGDTIDFSSSLSGQTITLTSGELLINHGLTITGLGASSLTVSGDGSSRIFDVDASGGTVSISGLTLDDGAAPPGPSPNGDGGAILVSAGTFALSDAVVSGNKTTGTGTTTHTCPSFCGAGGGISAESSSTTTLSDVTVSGNSTDSTAVCGGVASEGSGAVVITGSTITGNSSGYGGGVCTEGGGDLTITDSSITGNTAQGAVVGPNAIAAEGGGVDEDGGGTTTITGSVISGNFAYGVAGGIAEDGGGTVNLTSSTLSGNQALAVVGGNCVYAGPNYPDPCGSGTNGAGGGIGEDGGGVVNVQASAIAGNSTAVNGGGVREFAGTDSFTNTTFEGNTAAFTGSALFTGGGFSVPTATLASDTLDSNQGGSEVQPCCNSTVRFHNTIVNATGGSTACGSGTGTLTSLGHNLSSDSTCDFTATGDIQGVAPKLGSPEGSPAYEPELLGSPTIDAGDAVANCPSTDERGDPRPDNGETVCDIGAYEFQDPASGGGGGGGGGGSGGHASAPICTISHSSAVKLAKHKKHHKPKKGSLVLKVNCTQAVNATVTWKVVEKPPKKAHGKKSKTFHLKRVTGALKAGTTTALNANVSGALLAGLLSGGKETATFKLVASNGNGTYSKSGTIKKLRE